MNFGTKGKSNPFDSKNHADKTYNNIFRQLSASISSKQMENDHSEAERMNDEAMENLDKILELIKEREENLKIEDERFKTDLSEINTSLESQMASALE